MRPPTDTKEELLEAAIDLFATKGFAGTSIRDIARSMGMSISNIYHYFGNKEGLWIAILEYSVREMPGQLREVAAMDMDPLERFRLLIRTQLSFSKTHRRESKIFFVDEDMLTREGNEINRRLQSEILDIYMEQLTELHKLGHLRSTNVKIQAFNIFGVLNWVLRWHQPGGKLSDDEVYDEVTDFIMGGLTGPKDEGETQG